MKNFTTYSDDPQSLTLQNEDVQNVVDNLKRQLEENARTPYRPMYGIELMKELPLLRNTGGVTV
jgi:hypothetical protein